MLGQTCWLILLTQPWPKFNAVVGGKSYWLMLALNLLALVSVIFILPETKNISLERMEKVFGGVDFVEAGEQDSDTNKIESKAIEKEMHLEDTTATVQEVEDSARGNKTATRV